MPKSPLERLDTQVTPAPALEKHTRRQLKPGYRDVAVQKQCVLDERYERHPERFVRGRPMVPLPPQRQSASTRWRWPTMAPWMPIGLTSRR
ncbi:MAG: hypothetical protein ACNYPE_03340 [Candidatus Azotimanducaceae bacterium WSBS_2022_MAG_OTU7]